MAPHATPADFRKLAADYIVLSSSSNPSVPHYPLCITPSMCGSGALDSLESTGVCTNRDWVSDTWILQLRAVRRVQLTFTSEFSEETHMLGFGPKTVGQNH
jgi:hypothetical protein